MNIEDKKFLKINIIIIYDNMHPLWIHFQGSLKVQKSGGEKVRGNYFISFSKTDKPSAATN